MLQNILLKYYTVKQEVVKLQTVDLDDTVWNINPIKCLYLIGFFICSKCHDRKMGNICKK